MRHTILAPILACGFSQARLLAQARCRAQPTDVLCVTGSLLLVDEIKARLQGLALEF